MTVLEVATLQVKDGAHEDFEAAFPKAGAYLAAADGCRGYELARSNTRVGGYVLLVQWESVAHHVERFVPSVDFTSFKDLIWPYLATEPEVRHFEALGEEGNS